MGYAWPFEPGHNTTLTQRRREGREEEGRED